ncbi:calpain-2 catalytic subunit-like [Halichoeres trimaculatus]|uniref:calpain-2 catalytic subunit-like n=1 Tax=Halichoeres trimaculatus TaxID=147232 RepID=UPI003D9E9DE5
MKSIGVRMIHSLYEDGGEGSPSNPLRYKDQDYKQLKKSLLEDQKTFCDETFPPNLDSVGELEGFTEKNLQQIKWIRPLELNPDAVFVKDGTSRFDFQQGEVGNCWFLAAVGVLTFRKGLMTQVVPVDQSFKDNYAGIFHFRFWRFGKWVDVVIDDFLPTLYEVPLSVYSRCGKEFWALLLEKAYAKICGSYKDMAAGIPPEAFKDFSGGVHMTYELSNPPPDLWDVMNRAVQSKTMMGCGSFAGKKGEKINAKFNLVEGHIFAVTGLKEVESSGKKVKLVRVWNPWGEVEWNGDWCDTSDLWETVRDEVRNQCVKEREDGEFWMKMEDFCTYYEEMDICCDSPNFVDGDEACLWNCSVKEGRWEAGKSAGGSDFSAKEFWTNPQYRVTVKAVEGNQKGDKNVLLSLMQKPDEEHRSEVTYHSIGLAVFLVPPKTPKGRLPPSLFENQEPVILSEFHDDRELIEFHCLDLGEYLVIPCTSDPNKTASFIITIYSKTEADME